jgi:hypothetical protein
MATRKKTAPKKTAPKKTAKKVAAKSAKKTKVKKAPVPYLATAQGMKQLKLHCEGIMQLVGDLLVTNNPKISQKEFTTEAHGLIRTFFGMDKARASK